MRSLLCSLPWLVALGSCASASSTKPPSAPATQAIVVVPGVAPAPLSAAEPADEETEIAETPPRKIDAEHGARLAAAEQAFEAGNFDLASRLFRDLCQLEDRTVRGYACYRAAWTERARGDDMRALEMMVRLLDLVRPPKDEHERRLRSATIADLPSLYARVGEPSKAGVFLSRYLDPPEMATALSKLAQQYDDEGKTSEAATVRAQIR